MLPIHSLCPVASIVAFLSELFGQLLENLESSIMLRWKFAVCVIVKILNYDQSRRSQLYTEKHMALEKK